LKRTGGLIESLKTGKIQRIYILYVYVAQHQGKRWKRQSKKEP
jgi:hypothetical protein